MATADYGISPDSCISPDGRHSLIVLPSSLVSKVATTASFTDHEQLAQFAGPIWVGCGCVGYFFGGGGDGVPYCQNLQGPSELSK